MRIAFTHTNLQRLTRHLLDKHALPPCQIDHRGVSLLAFKAPKGCAYGNGDKHAEGKQKQGKSALDAGESHLLPYPGSNRIMLHGNYN